MVHSKSKKPTLDLHPVPFKPSHLSTPTSPFSPRTPLERSFYHQHRSKTLPTPDTRYVPPPPLQWLWQCHQCRRTYSLGVTRRCLEDGHHFCAGTTPIKTWRRSLRPTRVKKHKACASEFDYQGWKAWGRWKRSGRRDSIYDEYTSSSSDSSSDESMDTVSTRSMEKPTPPAKDCWNMCDYPSECRWGRRFGVHTPVEMPVVLPPIESFLPPPPPLVPLPSTPSEGILKSENCKETKKDKKGEKTDFWGALIASASRRKSVPPSSPLASSPDVCVESSADLTVRDGDGDVVMGSGDLDLATFAPLCSHTVSSSPIAAPVSISMTRTSSVVTLKDMIRKSAKRARSSSKLPEVKEERRAEHYEQALDGFSPLRRVKSRDSGYHSTPEVWELGKVI